MLQDGELISGHRCNMSSAATHGGSRRKGRIEIFPLGEAGDSDLLAADTLVAETKNFSHEACSQTMSQRRDDSLNRAQTEEPTNSKERGRNAQICQPLPRPDAREAMGGFSSQKAAKIVSLKRANVYGTVRLAGA
jgi:hypothetical protein